MDIRYSELKIYKYDIKLIPRGFVSIIPVREYNTCMSVVIFLCRNGKLEVTADRYAYDQVQRELVPYEKLFNLQNKYVIGFASESMAENTLEHFRLMCEPIARDNDNITEFVEVLKTQVFNKDEKYFRRPDEILIGGFDSVPRIFKLIRKDEYRSVSIHDHAFIGWVDGLEELYQTIKDSSVDIAENLLQNKCNLRPDLIKGIPKRYVIDDSGVQEITLHKKLTPVNQTID